MKIYRSVRERVRAASGGSCEKARHVYVVSGAADAASAVEAVRQHVPANSGSARLRSLEVISSPGGGCYEIAADYSAGAASTHGPDRSAGDRMWKFQVRSGFARLHESLGTVKAVSAVDGAAAPDPGTLMHWNGKSGTGSTARSVEVLEPLFSESCRATFAAGKIDAAYKRTAAGLTGKVNSETFHNWAPGEVLLESIIQGDSYTNSSGVELCDILFNFAIRPNGKRSCAGVTVDDVDGWDHLWALTGSDPANPEPRVRAIYASRIYERASFQALEI